MVGIRFNDFISEEYYISFKYKNGDVSEVYKNPTVDELGDIRLSVEMKRGNSYFSIKGLIVGDDVYVWTGEFLHDDMARLLNFYGTPCIPIYLEPKMHTIFISTTMMHGHGFTSLFYDKEKKKITKHVKSNTILKKIMGGFAVEEE